jgi:hypothetical protein
LLAAGFLAVALGACSANGQSGCNQPAVQQYPAPQLVTPASGSVNVPDNIGSIVLAVSSPTIVGQLALKSSSGASIPLNPTPDGANPTGNGGANQFKASIPTLAPATAYTLSWTLTYPAGCLVSSNIVNTTAVGNFTSQ